MGRLLFEHGFRVVHFAEDQIPLHCHRRARDFESGNHYDAQNNFPQIKADIVTFTKQLEHVTTWKALMERVKNRSPLIPAALSSKVLHPRRAIQMSEVVSVETLDDLVQFLTSTGHSADDFFSACGVDSAVSDTVCECFRKRARPTGWRKYRNGCPPSFSTVGIRK